MRNRKNSAAGPTEFDNGKNHKYRRRLLAASSAVLLAAVILTAAGGGFSGSLRNTVRGNDPLLRALIEREETAYTEEYEKGGLLDDKSLYALNRVGKVKVFLLEVHDKDGYDLTDFEKPEVSADLKLPATFKEGNSAGGPFFGGFGASAVAENATLEIKGSPKENRKYHNFKIRLKASAGRYNGQSIINLDKEYGNSCRIEEKFAFDLFAGLDEMMSLRTEFAQLYIKNTASPDPEYESYGLYILKEQPDENYFLNRSLDESGNLYRARSFDFTPGAGLLDVDDANYNKKQFEELLDIKQGESHTALLSMTADVNDMARDIDSIVEEHFNRENLLTYLAMNVILGNEESAAEGYLLYKPTTSAVWYILPEDMGGTMQAAMEPQRYQVMNSGLSQFSGNLLYERFLQKPGNVEALADRIEELMERIDPDAVRELTDQYIPVLADHLTVNPDRGMLKSSPDDIIRGVQNYYRVMLSNAEYFIENLDRPEPVTLLRALSNDKEIVLHWQEQRALLAEPVTYEIQAAADSGFKEIIFEAAGAAETSIAVPKRLFAEGQSRAYFRVNAVSENGRTAGSTNILKQEDGRQIYGAAEFTIA